MNTSKIILGSGEYKLLLQSFTQWLELLNYSPLAIPCLAKGIRDFFYYQEATGKLLLAGLESGDANGFIELLQAKGIYSNSHINKQIQALKLLSKYIRQSGKSAVGFSLRRLEEKRKTPVWLTKQEMQQLYEVIPDTVLGIRDKAMLAIYYGCGLRLNEGASIELNDIDSTTKVLHVTKGKHYKERFVPIAEKNFEEIRLYVDYGRPQLLQAEKHQYFFVDANKGRPMQRQSLYVRIKNLVKKSGIKKKVGTHTLRHSIATHLLQSGMKLERIQQFLGHADLDSTQIYTHLKNEAL